MKTSQFIIFLSVVFVVYFSVNYYIFIRGLQALPQNSNLRLAYKLAFLFLASAFIVSRFVERIAINTITETLVWVGGFWLAAMLYFILFIVVLDIIRLGNHFFSFLPALITGNWEKTKLYTFLFVNASVLIILISGFINASHPVLKEMDISINKKAGHLKTLKIAMASDIHLGTMIKNSRLEHLVENINAVKPDIILLVGDVVDESIEPVIKYNLGENLTKFKATYGVFAVTGNHEYIGGAEKSVKYCEDHGVKFIRDKAVLIDSSFYLVGREDRDMSRFAGKTRKALSELLAGVDKSLPVVTMNHQPFNFEEVEQNSVDLHLSGHTHHGQMWPFSYITKAVYELSWGYKKKGNSQFYVSSGYGTWGPPVRIGNTPEIVIFNVKFAE